MSSISNRRPGLGMLLRRSKSGEMGKGSRKSSKHGRGAEREPVSKSPPKLPILYKPSEIEPFGGEPAADSYVLRSGRPEDAVRGTTRVRAPSSAASARPSMEPRLPFHPHPAVPAMPAGMVGGAYVDPYARTESMTHRGRYSYASSAISTINSPRRVRRRKDPTPFNVLVVGTLGSGKTSFIEFLEKALALPKKRARLHEDETPARPSQGDFIPHYLETEIDHERVGLTIWDSKGLEKNLVDLQLREMSAFLENKFEETFAEEMKVVRSPGVQDTHIHAVFLVLDPARLDRNMTTTSAAEATNGHSNGGGKKQPWRQTRTLGGLDEDLDLQVLRTLQGKTTVVPVISKADTVTQRHMAVLKQTVWDSLEKAKLDPLEALGAEMDDGGSDVSRIDEADETDEALNDGPPSQALGPDRAQAAAALPQQRPPRPTSPPGTTRAQMQRPDETPFLPLSIISPDIYEPELVGRQFPWGFADPYNPEHCDFVRLKEAVFSDWRSELREASREMWYEGWRTNRLKLRDVAAMQR